jgi:alpha-amylase/alpha-mannosidase (GH57 family)/AraC-like DNA-binding protein
LSSDQFICIHGHFYQPPRENPWLEEVEVQESAAPYHDWNERITAECYAPNAFSRIMDPSWRIIGLINNYSKISFNFGPTLLYWLARHNPAVYESVLNADKESLKNFSGHGSAIAQVYNHMIMPLANRRDKETQVKWAIKDFEYRFERFPWGMWLPETAVDNETLEVLAENNIKFTVLSPHQAFRYRKIGDKKWILNSEKPIDPRNVYLCNLPSGKSTCLFFFDKQTASDIAFGSLLESGEAFAKRLAEAFKTDKDKALIETVASDGELYGHHHPHGDMTLAYCLYYIEENKLAKITNLSEFIDKQPPEFEVEIVENTSWSCIHGIERWRSNCGCKQDHKNNWNQEWRKPLREAMNWLRDQLAGAFEKAAAEYLIDPWNARNQYIKVILDRSKECIDEFLAEEAIKPLNDLEKRRVIKLLEMQRHALLIFTSCGWFFDEISGIETVQVMMYAARAMQIAKEVLGLDLEAQYEKILAGAPSNIVEFVNGEKVYGILVKPSIVDFAKIAAQNTIIALFSPDINAKMLTPQMPNCYFKVTQQDIERRDDGKFRLIINHTTVYSGITLDEQTLGCAAIWLGDHNVSCGAMPNMQPDNFEAMKTDLLGSFEKGQINEIIIALSKHFGANNYSLKDMFKDDQHCILDFIVEGGLKKARELFEIVYRDNSALMRFMRENRIPQPQPFRSAVEIILEMEIEEALTAEEVDLEQFQRLILNAKSFSINLNSELLAFEASEKITKEFKKLQKTPEDTQKIKSIAKLIAAAGQLPFSLNLWQSQNIAFELAETVFQSMKQREDETAKLWVSSFRQLCELIGLRLD